MINGYKIIALCIPKAYDNLCCSVITSLNKAAAKCGCRLFIYHSCSDFYWKKNSENSERAVFELMDFSVIDLTIIYSEKYYDKTVVDSVAERSLDNNVPVILIGGVKKGCTSIYFNYARGFEKVVRHIIEDHKINDIFIMAGIKDNDFSRERVDICKRVMAENNIEFDEEKVGYGDFWWGPTIEVMERLYAEKKLPKAFICINDSMAISVCGFLQSKGIKIPDDIAVTGFDGLDETKYSIPQITTCELDTNVLADTVMKIADSYFKGKRIAKRHEIDYSLRIRESCGCHGTVTMLNIGKLLKDTDEDFRNYQENDLVFFGMSEHAMNCNDLRELIDVFMGANYYDMAVLVNGSCFDKSICPTEKTDSEKIFDDYITLLFEKDGMCQDDFPVMINRKDILPDIGNILENNRPLLFNALGFMGIPYGYICLFFEPSKRSYSRIPQFISSLNYSIGCFRNMNYARYVAKSIEEAALYDYMTGLYNRSGFYSEIPKLKNRAEDAKYMTVALADLDGLKEINDTYGHDSGDYAINSLSRALNFIDMKNKICGRFGGDEFLVCIFSEDDKNAEERIRADITKYIEMTNNTEEKPFKLSASIGTASAPVSSADFDVLKNIADDRMYAEKITKPMHRQNRQKRFN